MGHGTFIHPGEFTELHEWDGPDWSGPLCSWVAKDWMDANVVLAWFLEYYNGELLPDLTAVERCYAHIGKDGCVFFHSDPGPGRFRVTHIWREHVKDVA